MDDLKKEYTILFTGITNTIATLEDMIFNLKDLQRRAEEAYIEGLPPEESNAPDALEESKA